MIIPSVALLAGKREGHYLFLLGERDGCQRTVAASKLEAKDVDPVLRAMSSLLKKPSFLMCGTLTQKRDALRDIIRDHGSALINRKCYRLDPLQKVPNDILSLHYSVVQLPLALQHSTECDWHRCQFPHRSPREEDQDVR
jgi:hypothetical protein